MSIDAGVLTDDVVEKAKNSDGILLGGCGPKWDT